MHRPIVTLLCTLALSALLVGCGATKGPRLANRGDGSCQDTVNGLTWRIERSETKADNMEEAQRHIARLNRGGKHTDWRLPTVYELYDLNTIFDLHQNGDCRIDREGKYWSGEKNGEGMAGAWEIAEQCDPERHYAPAGSGYVRAVRP
ncbi:MAG: DUF1566 domain-containing protein [Thermodesulfobacteriota bacterium]